MNKINKIFIFYILSFSETIKISSNNLLYSQLITLIQNRKKEKKIARQRAFIEALVDMNRDIRG